MKKLATDQVSSIVCIYLTMERIDISYKSESDIVHGKVYSRFTLVDVCPLETLLMDSQELKLREGPDVVKTLQATMSLLNRVYIPFLI